MLDLKNEFYPGDLL